MAQASGNTWSSGFTFILAAIGAAVGLANIWKFPYIAGENGGGTFVLVYLFCIALIGIPIMMAETMIGRRGRQSPINTMRTLAYEEKVSPAWRWLGWAILRSLYLVAMAAPLMPSLGISSRLSTRFTTMAIAAV